MQHAPAGFSTAARRVRSTTAKVVGVTSLGNMGHQHQPALILEIQRACINTQNSFLTELSNVKAKYKVLQSLPSLYIKRLYSKDALNLQLKHVYLLFPRYDFLYYCMLLVYSQHRCEF